MSDSILQILIQGGLASTALVSLYFSYKLASNHIQHNTDAMTELTKVLAELKQSIIDRKNEQ